MTTYLALERAIARVAAVLLALTGVFLTFEVVARYFFTKPTIWAAELSQLCLIWAVPIGMAWVLSTGGHIRITALTALAPAPLRRAMELVSLGVILAFSLVVTVYGYDIFADSLERGRTSGTMLNLKAWVREASVPAGFALLAVSCVANMWRVLSGDMPDTRATAE
jgi:TRAP-type C4-dicarboxylate transport system permease small subunit